MRRLLLSLPLLFALSVPIAAPAGADDVTPAKPKITIGKETTYLTGPLDKEGAVDYVAALNQRMSKGVTPDNNANILLWKSFGPKPEGARVPAAFWKWLGIDPLPEKGDYFVTMGAYFNKHAAVDPSKEFNEILEEMDAAHGRLWQP